MSVCRLIRLRISCLIPAALLFSATLFGPQATAQAASPETSLGQIQQNLDFAWTMLAATFVLSMQCGFLLLEAGTVRSKNSINVAQKNLADLIISGIAFGGVG